VTFALEKPGLFPLVVFVDSIADIPDAMKILLAIELGPENIGQVIDEATYISLNIQPPRAIQSMTRLSCQIVRVAGVEDSDKANCRPKEQYKTTTRLH
jgi:hypothetical protein